jgi:hypothetical protein
MRLIDGNAFLKALGIASAILVAVIVMLFGIDDFLSRIMGLSGGLLQTWSDIVSNLIFLFVLVVCVLYAAFINRRTE